MAATAVEIVAVAEVAAVAAIATAGEVVGYDDAAGAAVALAPERGMTQIWRSEEHTSELQSPC